MKLLFFSYPKFVRSYCFILMNTIDKGRSGMHATPACPGMPKGGGAFKNYCHVLRCSSVFLFVLDVLECTVVLDLCFLSRFDCFCMLCFPILPNITPLLSDKRYQSIPELYHQLIWQQKCEDITVFWRFHHSTNLINLI